ncbi:MAG: ATP-binding protein [Francisellaceae bacterium]
MNSQKREIVDALSLRARLVRPISLAIGFMFLIVFISLTLSYVHARRTYYKQVDTWLQMMPRYALPYLISSNYLPLKTEMQMIKATDLFSDFVLTNNHKSLIDEFHTGKIKPAQLIPIKDNANVIWGYYAYSINDNFIPPFLWLGLGTLLSALLVYSLILFWIKRHLHREFNAFQRFIYGIDEISQTISSNQSICPEKFDFSTHTSQSKEQVLINSAIKRLLEQLHLAQDKLRHTIMESERQKFSLKLADIALQVAHDIRSPLTALDAIVNRLTKISEDKKTMLISSLERIKDITSSLSLKYHTDGSPIEYGRPQKKLASMIIESIISEKKLEYGALIGIDICYYIDDSAHLAFVSIDVGQLKRVLSNLINNAIEAIETKGSITITLQADTKIRINIKDNGRGMPIEIIDKLGTKGFSHDKAGGKGLGLHHAMAIIQTAGGQISIESRRGFGSEISIALPLSSPPTWFTRHINFSNYNQAVIVDDCDAVLIDNDDMIRTCWHISAEAMGHKIKTYVSFKAFLQEEKQLHRDTAIYVDFELADNVTGDQIALSLENIGFTHISIVSGHDASYFSKMSLRWPVRDKLPPWQH